MYLGDEFTVAIGSNTNSTQLHLLNFDAPDTFTFVGNAQFGTVSSATKFIRRSGYVQLKYISPAIAKKGSTDRISITVSDTLTGKRNRISFTVLLV